eukprot:4548303-Pyramimonas_sp.AAC.1
MRSGPPPSGRSSVPGRFSLTAPKPGPGPSEAARARALGGRKWPQSRRSSFCSECPISGSNVYVCT